MTERGLMAFGRRAALRTLCAIHIFPSGLFLSNPFKIVELREILKSVFLQPNDVVLDIGCGFGIQALIMGKYCKHVVGVDLSADSIVMAKYLMECCGNRRNVSFIQQDVLLADFSPGSFDKITSYCVVEHVPDWMRALELTHKWLKPGGYLAISVDSLTPISDKKLVAKHGFDNSVAKYFTAEELRCALARVGFVDVHIHPILCSRYAIDLFTACVRRGSFRSSTIARLLRYFRLRWEERGDYNQLEGIFLVAYARKSDGFPQ